MTANHEDAAKEKAWIRENIGRARECAKMVHDDDDFPPSYGNAITIVTAYAEKQLEAPQPQGAEVAEAKDQLWQMAHVQDKQEDESAFMVNWLRGTIKIPQAVRDRIYWSEKAKREEAASSNPEVATVTKDQALQAFADNGYIPSNVYILFLAIEKAFPNGLKIVNG